MTVTVYSYLSPPIRAAAWEFETGLASRADPTVFQAAPTLEAGDVQVSLDGGAFANITTLPTAIDASATLNVTLSAAEMTANRLCIRFIDVAGAEWCDRQIQIFTVLAAALPTATENRDAILSDSTPFAGADMAAIKAQTDQMTFTGANINAAVASLSASIIDDISADNWSHPDRTLTMSAVQVAALITASEITVYRDATITIPLTGLGSIKNRTRLLCTVKRSVNDDDEDSILQVEEDALDEGLLCVNKTSADVAGPVFAGDGWITVSDEDSGDIVIKVMPRAATLLPAVDGLIFDVKVIRSTDDADPLTVRKFNIRGLATRAVA